MTFGYQLVHIAMISTFGFVIILGIATYGYSFKRKVFVPYLPILVYGIAITILFSVVYLPEVYNEIVSHEEGKDISKIYSGINILSAEVAYVVMIAYHRGIVNFLNKAYPEFLIMRSYVDDNLKEYRLKLFQFGLKAVGFPLILWATITFKALYYDSVDGESALSHLFQGYLTMIPYMIRSAPSNCLYGILLLTSFFMNNMISDVGIIVKEINLITFHKDLKMYTHFYRMQRSCDLSDQLDEISKKYTQTMRITLEYVRLVQIPWIASLGCNMIGATYGIFAQYTYIVNTAFDGEPYDGTSVFTGAVFILVSAIEIFLEAKIATENTDLVTI